MLSKLHLASHQLYVDLQRQHDDPDTLWLVGGTYLGSSLGGDHTAQVCRELQQGSLGAVHCLNLGLEYH